VSKEDLMTIAEFESRTEKDAVRMACIKLRVEPRGLRYEVVEDPEVAARKRIRIRVLEAAPPPDFGGQEMAPRRPERARDERPRDDRRRHEPREERDDEEHRGTLGRPETLRLAEELLGEVMTRMGIEAKVAATDADGTIELLLDTQETELLMADDAAVLGSLQYLVSRVVNKNAADRTRVVVHIEGLKQQRERLLTDVAAELLDKALATGMVVRVHPMSSADRRLVHTALAQDQRVETRSENAGPFRRLAIVPKR
jgi:spoIIIJ-associated protein